MSNKFSLLPRLIRLRDACHYMGMDKNRFNDEIRSFLTEIPIGKQGIAFDRIEIDQFIEHYISRNGVPGQPYGDQLWDSKERLDLSNAAIPGTSTKKLKGKEFAKALEKLNL